MSTSILIPESLLGIRTTTHGGWRITLSQLGVQECEQCFNWLIECDETQKTLKIIQGNSKVDSKGIKKYDKLIHEFNYKSCVPQVAKSLKGDPCYYVCVQTEESQWYLVSHEKIQKFTFNDKITSIKIDHGQGICCSKNFTIILSNPICRVKNDMYTCYMNKDLVTIEVPCDIQLGDAKKTRRKNIEK
jgi:hypothetical protein